MSVKDWPLYMVLFGKRPTAMGLQPSGCLGWLLIVALIAWCI